ncbi:iron-containing alcohol dehydrogenase [bacterium]|nr:iron-containing alcohol dehydrogenase [bacterium]
MNSYELLGKEFKCKYCGEIHRVSVRFIKKGKIEEISEVLKYILQKDKIFVLSDNITWEVAGEKIKEKLKNVAAVSSMVLHPEGEKRVTAKEEYLREIEKKIFDEKLIITVGTGTITDLGKLVGDKYNISVLSFPTAASMNGYTSGVAAYIKGGVKFTVSVKPADGVFMDYEIIKNAPVELTKAGFADSLAKSFANADWKTSSIITGESFCPLPYKIVSEAERKYKDKGKLLLRKDEKLIENLMEGLNLGGISMLIAGKSSPASGGEHLISHFLDMYAHQYKREIFAYHGLQVACGIYISSLLYEKIKNLDMREIKERIARTKNDYSKEYEKLGKIFPSSKRLLKKEFEKKVGLLKILREKLPEKWDKIKKEVSGMVYSPQEIKLIFKNASIPFLLKDIGVSENLILDNITLSRFIRGRLTILDIAGETGILRDFIKEYMEEK